MLRGKMGNILQAVSTRLCFQNQVYPRPKIKLSLRMEKESYRAVSSDIGSD